MVGFGKPDRAVSMRSYETGVDKGDYPSMEGDGEDVLPVDGVREPRTPGRGPDEGAEGDEPIQPHLRSPEAWGAARNTFRGAAMASGALKAVRAGKSPSRRLTRKDVAGDFSGQIAVEDECALLGPAALTHDEKCVVVRNVPYNASESDVRALLSRLKGAGRQHLTLSQQLGDPSRPRGCYILHIGAVQSSVMMRLREGVSANEAKQRLNPGTTIEDLEGLAFSDQATLKRLGADPRLQSEWPLELEGDEHFELYQPDQKTLRANLFEALQVVVERAQRIQLLIAD